MRASWKGQLRLQLVSCPVKLYPATTRAGKIGFHNLNPRTGNRINLRPHDADTGDEVAKEDIVKGYEIEKGHYVVLEDAEIEAVRIPRPRRSSSSGSSMPASLDPVYVNAPYFVAPDGPVAEETYRVIRDAMTERNKVGLGRVVLARRERVVAVEAYGRGIRMLTLYSREEVRSDREFFEEIGEGEPRRGDGRASPPTSSRRRQGNSTRRRSRTSIRPSSSSSSRRSCAAKRPSRRRSARRPR